MAAPLRLRNINIPLNPAYGGTIFATTVVDAVDVTLTISLLGVIVVVREIDSSDNLVVIPGNIPPPPSFQVN
jgi:hypothetical protein